MTAEVEAVEVAGAAAQMVPYSQGIPRGHAGSSYGGQNQRKCWVRAHLPSPGAAARDPNLAKQLSNDVLVSRPPCTNAAAHSAQVLGRRL